MTIKRFFTVLLPFVANLAFAQGVRTVVLDAGHGGKDPGCIWKNTVKEKDIVLETALMLGSIISERMPEVKVLYTRTTDVFVDLDRRAKVANDAKADLFISIHVNATAAAEGPSGAETFIMDKDRESGNSEMMKRENDVVMYEENYQTKYAEYLSGSPEMFIIYSLMQHANIERSLSFATAVQHNFKSRTRIPDRGVTRQNILVMWHTTMPGALVELGFINNTHDRAIITTAAGRRELAEAIFEGIKEYSDRQAEKDLALRAPEAGSSGRSAGFGTGSAGSTARDSSEAEAHSTTAQSGGSTLTVNDTPPTGVRNTYGRSTERLLDDDEAVAVKTRRENVSGSSVSDDNTGEGNYAIQILSSSRKVPKGSRELQGVAAIERYREGRYRYYYKRYPTRAAAEADLPGVRTKFKGAFISTIN